MSLLFPRLTQLQQWWPPPLCAAIVLPRKLFSRNPQPPSLTSFLLLLQCRLPGPPNQSSSQLMAIFPPPFICFGDRSSPTVTLFIGLFTCLLPVSTWSIETTFELFMAASPGPSTVPGTTDALSKYSYEDRITRGEGRGRRSGVARQPTFQAPVRQARGFTSLSFNVLMACKGGMSVKQGGVDIWLLVITTEAGLNIGSNYL